MIVNPSYPNPGTDGVVPAANKYLLGDYPLPENLRQPRDVRQPAVDDIVQHITRADAGQLVDVADQHQPVDAPLQQEGRLPQLVLQVVAGIGGDQGVACLPQPVLDLSDRASRFVS